MFPSLFLALAGLASLGGSFAQVAGWHMDTLRVLAVERLDSVVSPNQVASHMHQIVGGSAMGAAYNYADQIKSSCTTASITADKSNYWMPKLYWANTDGSFTPLPARHRFYYFSARSSPVEVVSAFPEGLRMLVGNPNAKTSTGRFSFTCIINSDLSTGSIGADNFNFNRDCPYGIRIESFFPVCWNGQDLYKSDGSHMAYPADPVNMRSGQCPWSHPVRIPQIMLEYTYLPSSWASGKTVAGNLVWANGDTTGYGVHADFVNGWDTAVLTAALNNTQCVGAGISMPIQQCEVFAPYYNANPQCSPTRGQMDEVSGASIDLVPVDSLPGCNPVWSSGSKPGCASAPTNPSVAAWQGTDGAYVATGTQNKARKLPTTPGWKEVGCIKDSWTGMLTGRTPQYYDTALEPKSCQATCTKQGFSWAIMGQRSDYRWDCQCGEGISDSASLYPGMCTSPCPGNSSATCGAYNVHSVWYAPPGTTVSNNVTGAADDSYLGCYYNTGTPNLGSVADSSYNDAALTTAGCLQTCANRNATWAATTNGKTCVCGSNYNLGNGYYVAESQCSFGCAGNSTEKCGWTYGYSVYNVTASKYQHETYNHPAGWTGCFNDPGTSGLNAFSWTSNSMTPEMCTYGCADLGYNLAGVVMGNRCKCDNTWKGGVKYPYTTCNYPCTGAANQTCGGNYLTEVYDTTDAKKKVALDVAARPAGWKGCYANGNGALFRDYYGYDGSLTVERCMKTCTTYGYTWGAVANQYYCRCTSTDPTTISTNPKQPSNVYCTAPCPGNKGQTCGAPGQYVEAYSVTANAAASNDTTAAGWVGCYSGSTGVNSTTWTQTDMTVDYCTNGCKELGFSLAALYGTRCTCGNTWDTTKGKIQPDFQCTSTCPGNTTQYCGGYQTSSVWNSSIGVDTPAKLQTGYIGCYADNPSNRALKSYSYSSTGMTNGNCKTTCKTLGYAMAATAGGNTCFCGNTIQGGYNYVSSQQCGIACAGNSASQCGGANNRVSVFNASIENATPSASASTSKAANTTAIPSASASAGAGNSVSATSLGCYTDPNTLDVKAYNSGYMTVDQCLYYCKGLNATYAGLVGGNTCRCGNTSPFTVTTRSECNTACVSNSKQTCGGSNRVEVYATTQSVNFVDPYKPVAGDMGCWTEASGNVMANTVSFTSSQLTPTTCSANCYARGLTFSASKGTLCYCGSAIAFGYARVADSTCSTACPGDANSTCGGYQVVNVRAAVAASSTTSASAASATPTTAAIEGYKGCYSPGTIISGATVKYTNDAMTTGLCRRYCRVNGFGAAALSAGNSCYCGAMSQLSSKIPDDSACGLSCKGDSSTKCGDVYLASVYDTTGAGARAKPGMPASWVGCFADSTPRILPDYSFTSTAMTADLCRRTCAARGNKVYGTSNSNQCFCGSVQPTIMTFDSNCNWSCAGNSTEICGASYKLSVYNADFALDTWTGPTTTSAAASGSASASASASKASSAVASPSASKASSAAASPSASKASSAAASPSASKASSAAASPSASKASSAAASPSASKASSAAASPSASKASSAAASPSKASSAAGSATSSIGGGLVASPSPSGSKASSAAASPSVVVPSSSKAAASPSATSKASSAAASPSTSKAASAPVSSAASSSTVSAPPPSATNHLGCYTQSTPILNKSVITCDTLTPGMCKLWCNANNYQYAGMTNGTTCGCANDITPLTLVNASSCSKDCFSDTTAKCGGNPGTYNVWKSSGLIARRNHRRRMRMVHGSKRTDEVPMAFANEEEILDYLKRQQISQA